MTAAQIDDIKMEFVEETTTQLKKEEDVFKSNTLQRNSDQISKAKLVRN